MKQSPLLAARAALLWPLKLFNAQTPLEHEAVQKILVLFPSGLGDTLSALSFLKNLRVLFPKADIALFAGPFAQQLLTDGFRIIPSQEPQERLQSEDYDLAIDLHSGPELASAKLCAAVKARWRAGLDIAGRGYLFNIRTQPEPGTSPEKAMQALLHALGSEDGVVSTELRLYPEDFAAAQARLVLAGVPDGPLISVHPGGLDGTKRWPAEKFAELMNILRAWHGVSFVLLGSANEKEYLQELGKASETPALAAAGLNLRVAAALIAKSRLFIGNDSGPLQLARALGVPTLSAMPEGTPKPEGVKSTVLYARNLIGLPAAEMAQAADRLLAVQDTKTGDK